MHELNLKAQEALSSIYGYDVVTDGFGYHSMTLSIEHGLHALSEGHPLETIAEAIHEGWAKAAHMFDSPEHEPNEAKRKRRVELATTSYSQLSEDDKEKDRVIAGVLL